LRQLHSSGRGSEAGGRPHAKTRSIPVGYEPTSDLDYLTKLAEAELSAADSALKALEAEVERLDAIPNPEMVDFFVDGEDRERLSAAFSSDDICLQWHDLSAGTLSEMWRMLNNPSGGYRELQVGIIFGHPLYLVERESIFSFKCLAEGEGADLLRVDLSPRVVAGFVAALADVG
jgi:hypothetical protein